MAKRRNAARAHRRNKLRQAAKQSRHAVVRHAGAPMRRTGDVIAIARNKGLLTDEQCAVCLLLRDLFSAMSGHGGPTVWTRILAGVGGGGSAPDGGMLAAAEKMAEAGRLWRGAVRSIRDTAQRVATIAFCVRDQSLRAQGDRHQARRDLLAGLECVREWRGRL